MEINTQNYKDRVRESLELIWQYEWDNAYTYCNLKKGHTINCNKYTSNTLEFASVKEQEDFWELSEPARQVIIDKLGVIYDDVWQECYDKYRQAKYDDDMIIRERGSLCY